MTRQLYVACFPKLPAEGAWVQAKRKLYDPKAELVEPHITLVFPTDGFSIQEMMNEVEQARVGLHPFTAVFRQVVVERDSLFLLPDAGADMFKRWHQRMYQGVLERELQRNIPYTPHITIGSGLSSEDAERIALEINSPNESFEVFVDSLSIVEIEAFLKPRIILETKPTS